MLLCLQSDDEEAAKEEEAEALRLQRKEAEALRPEDFGQPSEPESEEEAEDDVEEAGTLGAAAARVASLQLCLCCDTAFPSSFPLAHEHAPDQCTLCE